MSQSTQETDPNHDKLRAVLVATLVNVASRSREPVAYLQSAKAELTNALLMLKLPDGVPGRDATREQIAEALDQVWPEVVARFSN